MTQDHLYEVNLQWTDSRKGVLKSPVLPQSIEVATPPDFPKGIGGIWSPEHLFVASVNSCLMMTFLAIAENSGLEFLSFDSSATGRVDRVDGRYRVTEIILRPRLVIPATQNPDKARRILEMSERACLITGSINTVVHLEPEVLVG